MGQEDKNKQKKSKYNRLTIIQYILIIFLAIVLLTPFVKNMQFNSRISREIEEFRRRDNTELVTSMEERNREIDDSNSFYIDPTDPFEGTTVYTDRAEMLGVLTLPKIDEELSVYDRTDNLSLREGIGLLDGTHMPTGGIGNTTVLTGHNGMADATILRNLHKMEEGDVFTFDNGEEVLTYEIYDSIVVMPHETEYIKQIPDQDTMILLTCITPDMTKGINTHRLLVYAERIPTVEEEIQEIKPEVNSNTRYIIFGVAGIIVLFVVIGKAVYNKVNAEKN